MQDYKKTGNHITRIKSVKIPLLLILVGFTTIRGYFGNYGRNETVRTVLVLFGGSLERVS